MGKTTESYTLGQLRYDLAKLRGKGLVERVAGTQSQYFPNERFRRLRTELILVYIFRLV